MSSEFSEITITIDPEAVDLDRLHSFLVTAYWCRGIPKKVMTVAVEHSLPFSVVHEDDGFIGFARLVTDYATFSYLCDVFIDEAHRGKGYGHQLVKAVNSWIDDHGLRTSLLLTRDAQGLYASHDWFQFNDPSRAMRYKERDPDFYLQS